MYYKKEFGFNGEELAYNYLIKKGYSIINRNFSCNMGEVDLIGLDSTRLGDELVFIEVKARHGKSYGNPAEAVTKSKRRHIIKVAEYYLMINKLEKMSCRFDIIEVLPKTANLYRINHIKNAFDYSNI